MKRLQDHYRGELAGGSAVQFSVGAEMEGNSWYLSK